MAKKPTLTLTQRIARLKRHSHTAPQVEKVEKPKRVAKPGKQNAGGTGGAREGSGRKPLEGDAKRVSIKKSWEDFADEEILIDIEGLRLHEGTAAERLAKHKRVRVVQETLFAQAALGDVSAIKEFNDRVGGKARQPIVGDNEEDPISIDLGIGRMLDKAYSEDDIDTG